MDTTRWTRLTARGSLFLGITILAVALFTTVFGVLPRDLVPDTEFLTVVLAGLIALAAGVGVYRQVAS